MVNLVGGLYPGLYDWVTVEVPAPILPHGVCLTSDITALELVTSDVSSEVTVDACVRVSYSPKQKETTVLVIACDIDVRGRVIYETVECRDFVTSEVGVSYMDSFQPPSQPPTVCADVSVWYSTSAIDCIARRVVADVFTNVLVEADVSFCCAETPSWHE